MELHLDLVGGLAGDMFVAAMLDAFPQHEATVISAIMSVNKAAQLTCSLRAHRDQVLQGRRFDVELRQTAGVRIPFASPVASHEHTTWASIRSRLLASSLAEGAQNHAIGIFSLLADAEAFVHGVDSESVAFHEVGAWDSIADIVGAAVLIDIVGATKWTCSPAPLGTGRIQTAHGILPVPAPATTRLLLGMVTIDDGIAGERITPTGAAILRYLCPPTPGAFQIPAGTRTLIGCGTGFGSRKLPGISNHLRVLCFQNEDDATGSHRQMHALEFEVDDQSGEDLATGLERLRTQPGVLDVTQCPVFGKKGRMMVHVSVLARQAHLTDVVAACFRETTTIGLRHQVVSGIGLKRRFRSVSIEGQALRVKIVERPGGTTAKAESDDVLQNEGHQSRASLRLRAQEMALQEDDRDIHA